MRASSRHRVKAALFAAPVLFCLIAAGVFLHQADTSRQRWEGTRDVRKSPVNAEDSVQVGCDRAPESEVRTVNQTEPLQVDSPQAELSRTSGEELRKIRAMVVELADQLAAADETLMHMQELARQADLRRATLNRLRSAKEQLEAELKNASVEERRLLTDRDALLRDRQERQKTFSVTALTGASSGQLRPATFVECAERRAIIQPQATALSAASDVSDSQALLAAARRTNYVVFLVRPDGFETFQRYRALLLSESQQAGVPIDLGFEPVNADWVLVYPGQKGSAYSPPTKGEGENG